MNKRILNCISAAALSALLMPLLASCGGNGGDPSAQEFSNTGADAESREASGWSNTHKVTLAGKTYELSGENEAPSGDGVYYYSRETGLTCPPECSGEFTDYAVCAGTVVGICENSPSIIPEHGFVARFAGVKPENTPELGDSARCSFENHPYLPGSCVRFGDDIAVGITYRNVVRFEDDACFIYDEGWYTSSTFSNAYCTEVAVDENGTVVQVNASGGEHSGNTFIPQGGYVVAAGQGTAHEKILLKVKVGDKAEYVRGENIFAVKKYSIAGKNPETRPGGSSVVIYTSPEKEKTPAGEWLTEVIVGSDGRVCAIYPYCKGQNTIPDGGFAVSASGINTTTFPYNVRVGDLAVRSGPKNLYFINNAQNEYAGLCDRASAVESDLAEAKSALRYVDYEKIESALAEAKNALYPGGKAPAPGAALESAIYSARAALDICETELVPSLTVGDRAAWVTMGEADGSGVPYLHCFDEATVSRTVDYAKRLNLNMLIIDNLATGYSLYDSEIPGIIRHPSLPQGFDVIKAFSDECERQGIRLVVMLGGTLGVSAGIKYPAEHYSKIYADKMLKSNRGRTVDGFGASTLDPSWPEIHDLLIAQAKEIVENYPGIWGIQFDYIRYPLPVYYQADNYEDFGYDSPASQAFAAKYGVDPKDLKITDGRWESWCAARRDVITALARDYRAAVNAVRTDINVSFTCFADYNDRQKYVYQEPEKWAAEGIADAIYPMIYGDTTEYQLRYANEIAPVESNAAVLLGVGTYVRASEKSIAEQLYMPFELGMEGTSNFTLRYISTCGYYDITKTAFRAPATPSGAGAQTVIAVREMLADRLEKLMYLYPGEKGLSQYHAGITLSSTLVISPAELLAKVDIADPLLRETLAAEAEYAERLISRAG